MNVCQTMSAHCFAALSMCFSALLADCEVITGDGPLPMAIFELLEYIVNEVTPPAATRGTTYFLSFVTAMLDLAGCFILTFFHVLCNLDAITWNAE